MATLSCRAFPSSLCTLVFNKSEPNINTNMINNALTLKEIKQLEVGILEYVSSICNKNHLTYFLSYGTLIGAIRHKGFIPWDDDIDIAMPRSDYMRLLEILQMEEKSSRYECLVPLKDGYFYEFAKVIDTATVVQEQQTITAKCGVWIDIFPLDGLKKEDKLCHNLLLLYNRFRAAAVNVFFPHKTSGFMVPFEYCIWKLCRWIGFKPFLKRSLSLAQKYKYDDCEFVGFASSYPAYNKYMKKEWFEDVVEVEFEGRKFKAPRGYHEYLTTQYGDYMQLPPEDKRVCHHMVAYKRQ